jgi:hypothetical protein
VVLVITQLLNIALVPLLKHAGLALSIGLGAMINAGWLLVGLLRRGSYRPAPAGGCLACRCWPPVRCWRFPDVGRAGVSLDRAARAGLQARGACWR